MAKAKASKSYLKLLGIIFILLGLIIVASGIAIMAIPFDLASIENGMISDIISTANGDVNAAKIALGIIVLIVGLWEVFEGWLLCRAAKHPKKTILIMIITIISVVGSIYTMIKAGFGDPATTTSNIVGLAINVLALMAIVNVRFSS